MSYFFLIIMFVKYYHLQLSCLTVNGIRRNLLFLCLRVNTKAVANDRGVAAVRRFYAEGDSHCYAKL
jgi:hypothetical protein